MSGIAVIGAGAFGTSLALTLAQDGSDVALWGRDADDIAEMARARTTGRRLPGFDLPSSLTPVSEIDAVTSPIALLAIPMQSLGTFLAEHPSLRDRTLVACCKGVDRATGLGPVRTIQAVAPDATAALLTGPSFAADIARGLPTALTLAAANMDTATQLQAALSRPTLRLYRTTDTIGAELGGALKNVIALAAGMAIGAGFGDSARAAVIARGFAELTRYATSKGAAMETLQGLSGLGDLVLTCTSEKSRNFTAGLALGRGEAVPAGTTVEGIATAAALADEAQRNSLDLPLTIAIHSVASGTADVAEAVAALLARPPKQE